MLDWQTVDTVFLDVDGTLIDLYFEYFLWNDLVPKRYAAHNNISVKAAVEQLYGTHMPQGIDLYNVPNWSKITGLDVLALHRELIHLLRFRPTVETFLQHLATRRQRVVIVTNAHTSSFVLKNEVLNLTQNVDTWYSSEHIGLPKEDPKFWSKLAKIESFEPSRTLFIDDTTKVLDSAQQAGIVHLFTTTQPNLKDPIRVNLTYPAIHDYAELNSGV